MARVRRLGGWLLFLAILGGVGWIVFNFVRCQPRCLLERPEQLLQLTDDGAWLIGFSDGKIQVQDTHSGEVARIVPLTALVDLEMSPDKRLIAALISDSSIGDSVKLVDWRDGTEHTLVLGGGHKYVHFSPQGKWLAAEEHTGGGKLYRTFINVEERKVVLRRSNLPFYDFCGEDGVVVLVDYPKTGGVRKPPALLDLRSGNVIKVWDHGPALIAFSPCGKLLAVCSPKRALADPDLSNLRRAYSELVLEVWDVSAMTRIFQHHTPSDACIYDVKFAPDSQYLAALFGNRRENRVTVFQLSSGKAALNTSVEFRPSVGFAQHKDKGDLLALVTEVLLGEQKASMWSIASGQLLWKRSFQGALSIVPGGQVLLCTDEEESELLDPRTGERMTRFVADSLPLFTPDGQLSVVERKRQGPDGESRWRTWLRKQWPGVFGSPGPSLTSVVETRLSNFRGPKSQLQAL